MRGMFTCSAPAALPPREGRCSHGLLARASLTLTTAQCAGRLQSLPCMTSVALTCADGLLGFASETDTSSDSTRSCLNILGVTQPSGRNGARVGSSIAGLTKSGNGQRH
eukprot:2569213-Prymnesium_polylepis.1